MAHVYDHQSHKLTVFA